MPFDSHLLFCSHNAGFYASRYREDNLTGGHVIKLGPGNDMAAQEALAAWPGGLQIGGGITIGNAKSWLDKGAAKVQKLKLSLHGSSFEFCSRQWRQISNYGNYIANKCMH